MNTPIVSLRQLAGFASLLVLVTPLAFGQNTPSTADLPAPVRMTNDEDRKQMMEQLGIQTIRPGASGTAGRPDSANYDESKATAKSPIPEVLTLQNGQKVTTAEMWWNQRRPEIVEDFDREMYGRVPANVPKVTWEVTNTVQGMNGTYPIITKTVVGHVDNSAYPAISVNIQLTLTTPGNATGPVPVMMQFSAGGGGPGPGTVPAQLSAAELTQINAELKALVIQQDPTTKQVFDAHPTYNLIPIPAAPNPAAGRGGVGIRGGAPGGPAAGGGLPWQQQLLAKGWGYAVLSTSSIQTDSGGYTQQYPNGGLTEGIIGLANKGQSRKPEDWGVLRAWAWGASRALDYFATDKAVDAKQVGLEGHSRWGKATIVAMAYDQRFAIAYVSSSGEGGAKIWRHLVGETVENIAAASEYHWMAGNFIKYAGPLTVDDLPVDAHELVAMCAPRPVFISGGAIREQNGDSWQDPKGMFMAAAYAAPVYTLLGKRDLGTTEFPPMTTPLIDGDIAYRQHDQGHVDSANWPTFITFASRYLHASKAQ